MKVENIVTEARIVTLTGVTEIFFDDVKFDIVVLKSHIRSNIIELFSHLTLGEKDSLLEELTTKH